MAKKSDLKSHRDFIMVFFDFSGQWIGSPDGDPKSTLVLDLDSTESGTSGFAYIFSSDTNTPSSLVEISIETSEKKFSIQTVPRPINPQLGAILSENELSQHYPSINYPNSISIDFEVVTQNEIAVTWRSDAEIFGFGKLKRSMDNNRSTVLGDPTVKTWGDFKVAVSNFKFQKFIFRGQSSAYPLRTTFHRTKRNVLHYYLNNDIQILHRSLTGRTRHIFDLNRPSDLGALMNLAQHHGFPTPLLDWTYSPFVAAWFAYRNALKEPNVKKEGNFVRIYALDRISLLRFPQYQNITHTVPHTSIIEALPIDNERAIPQQGLLMLTNVNDIEDHIGKLEDIRGQKILHAYDLPMSDAENALNDLAMMGINRSTMMPGIDSICLDLKDRLFQ